MIGEKSTISDFFAPRSGISRNFRVFQENITIKMPMKKAACVT
jgi:hypothetical protein